MPEVVLGWLMWGGVFDILLGTEAQFSVCAILGLIVAVILNKIAVSRGSMTFYMIILPLIIIGATYNID